MKSFFKYNLLILLIIGVLNLSLKIAVIQFEYTFKNQAFTEKYCINKDKPELKCNGKCHLKKSSSENQNQSENSLNSIYDLIFDTNFNVIKIKTPLIFTYKEKIISFENCKKSIFNKIIDHPPQDLIIS